MFCDIRGFTSMVEQQTPEETIELLNTYYTLMFDAISGRGGVVNQMIGDGLMAHLRRAAAAGRRPRQRGAAALDMIEMIELFNVEREAAGKAALRIGVGIATGEMVAGYTGTQARATYTCIGDTVNLAARLEAHTKLAGQPILIDAGHRDGLGERVAAEALGGVAFKGKALEVPVFAVLPPA